MDPPNDRRGGRAARHAPPGRDGRGRPREDTERPGSEEWWRAACAAATAAAARPRHARQRRARRARSSASRLYGPPPAAARNRYTKQNCTTTSPPLRIGKTPRGRCAWKYATAISPARTKATGRVRRPSTISTPPKVSSTPAIQNCENIGGGPVHGR